MFFISTDSLNLNYRKINLRVFKNFFVISVDNKYKDVRFLLCFSLKYIIYSLFFKKWSVAVAQAKVLHEKLFKICKSFFLQYFSLNIFFF